MLLLSVQGAVCNGAPPTPSVRYRSSHAGTLQAAACTRLGTHLAAADSEEDAATAALDGFVVVLQTKMQCAAMWGEKLVWRKGRCHSAQQRVCSKI